MTGEKTKQQSQENQSLRNEISELITKIQKLIISFPFLI